MYQYTVTLLPYEDRQFNDAKQFGRALEILALKLQNDKVEIPRYTKLESGEHGRLITFKDADLPPCRWVITTKNKED